MGAIYSSFVSTLSAAFDAADRLFNRLFGAEYNPIYRSGTIAVLLMMIATATGLVLVFFYRLGDPWESVQALQQQAWFGRWLRSMHRYSSDASVAAVLLHAFRMFAQGKSWGPRAFSWVTGVFLLLFLFISAWTGFVLPWDAQAQAVAVAGARIVDSLGFLADPLLSSFNGAADSPPASFFFLNLFLHVVVPLGMIFGVWVHTSRMARTTWFPHRGLLLSIVALFFVLGISLPAPLGEKADLLALPAGAPLDLYFQFWLPLSEKSPRLVFWAWAAFLAALLALPWVLRPRGSGGAEAPKAPAFNDPKICQGCRQCVKDCPYEAIEMVPRMAGPPVSREVAQVISSLCVSCGLCSASCSPMTMGPPGRKGTHQYLAAKSFLSGEGKDTKKILVIACRNQPGTYRTFEGWAAAGKGVEVFPSECLGTLHMSVVELLAADYDKVFLAACPERNCTNKDAAFLLRERLEGKREAGLLGKVPKDKIVLHPVGAGGEKALWDRITGKEAPRRTRLQDAIAVISGFALLLGVSAAGRGSFSHAGNAGVLRLDWRLAGQSEKICTTSTRALPAHMKAPETCRYTMLSYQLEVKVDGEVALSRTVKPGGFRQDRPLYVAAELPLKPGRHRVEVSFVPEKDLPARRFRLSAEALVKAGRVSLVFLPPDQSELTIKEVSP